MSSIPPRSPSPTLLNLYSELNGLAYNIRKSNHITQDEKQFSDRLAEVTRICQSIIAKTTNPSSEVLKEIGTSFLKRTASEASTLSYVGYPLEQRNSLLQQRTDIDRTKSQPTYTPPVPGNIHAAYLDIQSQINAAFQAVKTLERVGTSKTSTNLNPDSCMELKWPTGEQYIGYTSNNQHHGIGKYTSAHGNTYEGQWQKGKREGFGVKWDSKGKIVACGTFKNDQLVNSHPVQVDWLLPSELSHFPRNDLNKNVVFIVPDGSTITIDQMACKI